MATNLAIMGNMHIGHNPVVIANTGNPYILVCARVNGDILSYGIIVANFQSCGFASIFFVLGNTANRTKSVKLIVLADIRMAINYAMWSNKIGRASCRERGKEQVKEGQVKIKKVQ